MRIRLNLIKILDKLHESAISKPTFMAQITKWIYKHPLQKQSY